jgi:translation elongation factor P/translation initiation factor 5A
MKKKAKDLKKGDKLNITGKKFTVENIEFSEIGKQGTKKCRLELKAADGEKVALVRPEDYPFELE